jgi:hypothetical protein
MTRSYTGAAKKGKNTNDPHNDEMTAKTANTTMHDDDRSSTSTKPNADSLYGSDRKRMVSKTSTRSPFPKKVLLKQRLNPTRK